MDQFKSPMSSNIKGARYHNGDMEVDFNHATYVYRDFPVKLWNQFKSALSKGSFHAAHIKDKHTGLKKMKYVSKGKSVTVTQKEGL